MTEEFAVLLFAYAVARFGPSADWLGRPRGRWAWLGLQLGLFGLAAWIGLTALPPLALGALLAAHLAFELFRLVVPRRLELFFAVQAAHLGSLAATAIAFPDLWATGPWAAFDRGPGGLALIAGLILTTRAGGEAIGLLMDRWLGAEEIELPKGLPRGGLLIGLLERGLIFLLVMVGQAAAIGFLIAAKSILRFDAASKDQSAGEYVIVGTLASFAWALAGGYATLALLRHLPPVGILPPIP